VILQSNILYLLLLPVAVIPILRKDNNILLTTQGAAAFQPRKVFPASISSYGTISFNGATPWRVEFWQDPSSLKRRRRANRYTSTSRSYDVLVPD